MIFKDYYKILEISNYKASVDEIKQAYREQAKKYHPDINSSNASAEERFKDINEAYKVLSDPHSRRKYDRMWYTHVGKKQKTSYEESKREKNSVFSDFFQMFFGEKTSESKNTTVEPHKNKKVAIKGENIDTEINVSISEAFYGQEKKISLRTLNGKMKTFTIKIPAGIRNHEKIRLMGQGKPGENGGRAGDLLIKIQIENDEKYQLEGIDLYTNLYLSPWEAALGTKTKLNSIDEEVSLHVPQGIQSGEIVRLAGKGYLDGKGGRGDLIARVCIMVPKDMTEQEKKLFQELQKISKYDPRKTYNKNKMNSKS